MAGVVCGGCEPESNRRRRKNEDTVERRIQRRTKNDFKKETKEAERAEGMEKKLVNEFREELIYVRRKRVGKFGKQCF
jgi:hypothetical protein